MEAKRGESSLLSQLAVDSSDDSCENDEVDISKLLPVTDQQKHGKIKRKSKTKKHYVTDKKVKPEDRVKGTKDETVAFRPPKDLAVFAHDVMTKAWRNDERIKQLKLNFAEKTDNSGRLQPKDMQRLYVEEPPMDSTKTVCDVDPHYFKVIESKPEKLNMKDYIQILRDSLRIKIVNGYLEDDIMLLEENLFLEQKMLDIIRENYQKYVNIFEEFLYEDHTTSKRLLQDSEESAKAAEDTYQEYRLIARKLSAVRSTLFITEEKWRTCKIYEKFLYAVSPAFWRAAQSEYRRGSIFMKDESKDDLNIFGSYRQSLKERNVSITDMIEVFYRESRNERPPEIYFTTPDQLLDIFTALEMQNLNALLICKQLEDPIMIVKDGLSLADKFFTNQIDDIQKAIQTLEEAILWEENNSTYSIEVAKNLLDDQFRKAVMDEDVLNLQVFVEDAYESKIGVNTANLGMLEMMTEIENKYYDELLSMDKIPSLEVAILETSYFEEEVRVMQLAERATKQIAEMQREIWRLNKSYAPPFRKPGGKLVNQRSPVKRIKAKITVPVSTALEDEYLHYFTDYCGATDNFEVALVSILDKEEK